MREAPTQTQTAYWQGVMDGVSFSLGRDRERVEEVRLKLAAMIHVCYPSIIGPYCVICHRDVPAPYDAIWSDSRRKSDGD